MLFALPPPQAGCGRGATSHHLGHRVWSPTQPAPSASSGQRSIDFPAARRALRNEASRSTDGSNSTTVATSRSTRRLDDLYDLTGQPMPRSAHGGPGPYEVFTDSRFAVEQPLHTEAPFDLRLGEAGIRGRVDAIYGTEHSGRSSTSSPDGPTRIPATNPASGLRARRPSRSVRRATGRRST